MRDINGGSKLLFTFKTKIEESVALVPNMVTEEKIKAAEFWNLIAEKLQEIVNNSAADASTLTFDLEIECVSKLEDVPDKILQEPHHLLMMGNSSDMLLVMHSHDLPTFGNTLSPEQTSTIPLVQHKLAAVLPKDTDRMSPSLVLNCPPQTLLSTELPIEDQQNSRAEVSLTPSESRVVQIEDGPRMLEAEIVTQTNQDAPLGEISPNVPALTKGPTCKNAAGLLALTQKTNKAAAEAINSSNATLDIDALSGTYFGDGDTAASMGSVDEVDISDCDKNDTNNDVILPKIGNADEEKVESESVDADEVAEVGNAVNVKVAENCPQKAFFCTGCGAHFTTRESLTVHCRRHAGEKPFACSQCSSKFTSRGALRKHVRTHSGIKPWRCTECDGSFTEKKSLREHMRKHTGEKPYMCDVCGKNFGRFGTFKGHMATHKEHLCKHCGMGFLQKSQLNLHVMRHEGLRKYQCNVCPARFRTKGNLKKHGMVHTGERPFACELCDKNFTSRHLLSEHKNWHYDLKPYKCRHCGKGFARLSTCSRHTKSCKCSGDFDGSDEREQILKDGADLGFGEVVEIVEISDSGQTFETLVPVVAADNEVVVGTQDLDKVAVVNVITSHIPQLDIASFNNVADSTGIASPEPADENLQDLQHLITVENSLCTEEDAHNLENEDIDSSDAISEQAQKELASKDTEGSASSSGNVSAVVTAESDDVGIGDPTIKDGGNDVELTKSNKGNPKKMPSKRVDANEAMDVKFPNTCQRKRHVCPDCDARFGSRSSLIVHCRRHTGDKPFVCEQCSAKFSTNSNLTRHIKTHSREKRWRCTKCGGIFKEESSLKMHMRKQPGNGKQPHQYVVCGTSLESSDNLQNNMMAHADTQKHLEMLLHTSET